MNTLIAALLLLSILILVGCGSSDLEKQYESAILSARNIEAVRQVQDTFPDGVHWISHFTQQAGDPIWYSEVAIEDRYIFTLQIPIDVKNGEVRQRGVPTRTLVEVVNVDELPDGRAVVHYGSQWTVNDQQWETIVESSGDFGAAGIELGKGEPVEGFERALNPLHWKE